MRLALRFAGLALAVAAAWALALPRPAVVQPVAFNHARHAELACAVCHRGVQDGGRAGIPQAPLCLKCHASAPAGVPDRAWEEAAREGRIAWVQVTRTADHVMFSHRRHVALGRLECQSCHGDIGSRPQPPARAPILLDMDTCIACHEREGVADDCAACHR